MRIFKNKGNKSHQVVTPVNNNFYKVSSFNYLGVTVGQTWKDMINKGILQGNRAYTINKNVLFKQKVPNI